MTAGITAPSPSAATFPEAVQLAMRQFLASKNSGCVFARRFAVPKNGPIDWIIDPPLDDSIASRLDPAFDNAAKTSHAAIAVFTTVETVDALVDILAMLARGDRWRLREERWKGTKYPDVLVGIDWTTTVNRISSVMGLAPFPTMPIYRRAPYVALALWPGDHENPLWEPARENKPDVGFIDMPTGLRNTSKATAKQQHAETRKLSRGLTRSLAALPRSEAGRPDVAFSLDASVRVRLLKDCAMSSLASE